MRQSNADRMIEQQIAIELDRLNSIFPDEEEKAAIIKRIADLKAMLTPSSSVPPLELKSKKSLADVLSEAVAAFRYR